MIAASRGIGKQRPPSYPTAVVAGRVTLATAAVG